MKPPEPAAPAELDGEAFWRDLASPKPTPPIPAEFFRNKVTDGGRRPRTPPPVKPALPPRPAPVPLPTGPTDETLDQIHVVQKPGAWPRTARLTLAEKHLASLPIYPDVRRPETRGDCVDGPRPCPFVSCKYHLFLEVTAAGTVHYNWPDKEPWDIPETCALDVADRGGETLENIGAIMSLTRERVRQIEVMATENAGYAVKSGTAPLEGGVSVYEEMALYHT